MDSFRFFAELFTNNRESLVSSEIKCVGNILLVWRVTRVDTKWNNDNLDTFTSYSLQTIKNKKQSAEIQLNGNNLLNRFAD